MKTFSKFFSGTLVAFTKFFFEVLFKCFPLIINDCIKNIYLVTQFQLNEHKKQLKI